MSGPVVAKLVLHIGQHKTGSTALQSFLTRHAAGLSERGLLYPAEPPSTHGVRSFSISHYRLFVLLRREVLEAVGERAEAERFWEKQRRFCAPFGSVQDFFEALESERTRLGAGTVILSAEDLFDLQSAHEIAFSPDWVKAGAQLLARFAATFHYAPRVVAYVRRQDHLLAAHYGEYIKGNPGQDVEFGAFAEAFAPRLRTHAILAPWVAAFGAEHVAVRPYEAAVQSSGIVSDFFDQALGLSVPSGLTQPLDALSRNASPDRDHLEFLRHLRRGSLRGGAFIQERDVLAAARLEATGAGRGTGIGAWLSPQARRDLLAVHAEGNAALARLTPGRMGHASLFTEPLPADDAAWHDYPGLSPARLREIAANVRQVAAGRPAGQRLRWFLRVLKRQLRASLSS